MSAFDLGGGDFFIISSFVCVNFSEIQHLNIFFQNFNVYACFKSIACSCGQRDFAFGIFFFENLKEYTILKYSTCHHVVQRG